MVKKLDVSTQSQQDLGGQTCRIVQRKLGEELSSFDPEQIGEFVEYPVTMEDGSKVVASRRGSQKLREMIG